MINKDSAHNIAITNQDKLINKINKKANRIAKRSIKRINKLILKRCNKGYEHCRVSPIIFSTKKHIKKLVFIQIKNYYTDLGYAIDYDEEVLTTIGINWF